MDEVCYQLSGRHNSAIYGRQYAMVTEPVYRVGQRTHAWDSDGVYFELIEAVDGSDLQMAMQNWQHK